MHIKAISVAGSTLLIVGSIAISIVVLFTTWRLHEVTLQSVAAEDLIKDVFELNILAQTYTTHPEERPREQWFLLYDQVSRKLDSGSLASEANRAMRDELRSNLEDIRYAFDRLVTQVSYGASSDALEKQLSGDLLEKTQHVIAAADILAQTTLAAREATRSRADKIILLSLAALTAATIAVFFTLYRKVVRPLVKLHKGVAIVSKGDLNYRVGSSSDDELGQLSREFDTMTSRLKISYDTLEGKVRQRTAELADLNRKNEILLESIGDGVVAIDTNWKIILWNPAATNLTGWSREEAMGKQFKDIVRFVKKYGHTENVSFIEEAMKSGTSQNMAGDTLLIRKDGVELPVGDSAAPVFSDAKEVTGAIIVFRDMSRE